MVGRRLENPQLEEEREWLRETRHFRTGHPCGHSGSLQLAKLQIKQGFCLRSDMIMCCIMLVTPGKGNSIPYNVVFDSLTQETVHLQTEQYPNIAFFSNQISICWVDCRLYIKSSASQNEVKVARQSIIDQWEH